MTLRYGPTSPLPRGVERADHPIAQLVHPFQQVEGSHARDAWTVRGLALGSLVPSDGAVPRHLCCFDSRSSSPPLPGGALDHVGCHASRSMRPRICRKSVGVKWLSASWRMKYRACRMRRPPVFEEPLLETRQGPVLAGHGENEPAQEIAEVVGDHPEEQPHLIGPEPVTGEAVR